MWASEQISPYQLFSSLYVSMNASLTHQRGQLSAQAHLKGIIVYFIQGKYYEKNTSRFWEI